MASNYSRWYREGTVAITQGSVSVAGTDTYWLSAGLHAGDIFSLDGVTDYEIDTVSDNTHLTLRTAYLGDTVSEAKYSIVRQFTATMSAEIAAKTSDLLGDFARYIDTDMQSIHGKSAYEIAKAHSFTGTESEWLASLNGKTAYQVAVQNGYTGSVSEWLESLNAYGLAKSQGYTGTLSQWLESLKADNEWSTLDARTQLLVEGCGAGFHNSIFRGKNLGSTITDAQYTAISTGTFDDLFVGDYWDFVIDGVNVRGVIAGFNLEGIGTSGNGSMLAPNVIVWFIPYGTNVSQWKFPLNDGPVDPTTGWKGMTIYTETLPLLFEKIETVIPASHILSGKVSVCDAVNSNGTRSHVVEETQSIFMPTWPQISGQWSDDNSAYPNLNIQFPLTRHMPAMMGMHYPVNKPYFDFRGWYWLARTSSLTKGTECFGIRWTWNYQMYLVDNGDGTTSGDKVSVLPYVHVK